jgi:protein TonB
MATELAPGIASGTGWDGGGQDAFRPRRSYTGIAVVIGLHLVLFWALATGLAQRVVEVVRAPLETKLIEEVKPPPPPPPPELPPPRVTPPPMVLQVPVPLVPPPPNVAQPPPSITQPPPPPVAPPPAQTAPPPTITPPQPAARPATTQVATPEQLYSARLLDYVNSIKRYPTGREARQLRPQGIVKVWLELDRNGDLLDSGIESSAGILMLDQEALRSVRNGRFPPIPADAFTGQAKRRFVVAMEYLPPGN